MIIEGENIYHTFLYPNAIRGALTAIAIEFQNSNNSNAKRNRYSIYDQKELPHGRRIRIIKNQLKLGTQTKPVTLL